MADDKKNIGPEAEKLGEALQEKKAEPVKDTLTAPEQPAPGAPQAPVVETAPKAPPAPTVESKPEEKAAPAPKVLDFSVAKIRLRERRKQRRRKSPSRSRRKKSPSVAVRPKLTRPRLKSPSNPETKCPKVRKFPARRLPFPQSRKQLPRSPRLPSRSSLPLPVTLSALPSRSRSSISICPSCIHSKTIPLVSVTIQK